MFKLIILSSFINIILCYIPTYGKKITYSLLLFSFSFFLLHFLFVCLFCFCLFVLFSFVCLVMLPLDTITSSMTINNPSKLSSYLTQLKDGGVAGVMSGKYFPYLLLLHFPSLTLTYSLLHLASTSLLFQIVGGDQLNNKKKFIILDHILNLLKWLLMLV